MKTHTKVYTEYFHIGQDDKPECEMQFCDKPIVDIHHIYGRGPGKDRIENLIGLCRDHHISAHNNKISKFELTEIHKKNMANGI